MGRALHRVLAAGGLIWPAQALAFTWWVPDDDASQQLAAELALVWPDSDAQIRVGEPDGTGVWWRDGSLVMATPDGDRRQAVDDVVAIQVLLVRSWSTAVEVHDGWVPEPERVVEVPEVPYTPLVELDESPVPRGVRPVEPLAGPFPRVEVGLGVRGVEPLSEGIDGTRVLARFHAGAIALEANLGLGFQVAQRADDAFVVDPAAATARWWDTLHGGVGASLGLPVRLRPAVPFWIAPRAYVGVDVRRAVSFQQGLNDVVHPDESRLAIGPTLGVTTDLWWRDRVGLRLGVYERVDVPTPTAGQKAEWHTAYGWTADLLFAL